MSGMLYWVSATLISWQLNDGEVGLKLDGFVRALFNTTDRLYCYLFASRLVSEPQSGQCNCAYLIVGNGDPPSTSTDDCIRK